MFDKVVLCNQGSSILSQVRSRKLSLKSDNVKVLLLGGDKIASNWDAIEVASGETGLSVSLKEKQIPSYVISSFFSCLSELHVVARCKDTDKPSSDQFAQCHGVLVAVNNQAIILAVSDENIVVNDKLFMTFDVEETNNVLTAKADFDGVITQGILEERLKKIGDDLKLGTASQKDYSDNVLEENGGGKLPTNDAIKTHVQDGALRIVKGSDGSNQTNTGLGQDAGVFTANQKGDTTFYLGLGAAADKGVATSFTSKDANEVDVPTTRAVSNFVSGAIGTSNLNIMVGGNTVTTFNANQSGDVDVTLALGTAADANVCTEIHQEDQQGTSTELNNAQLNSLVTLQQARQIADESTSSSKSVSPAEAANVNGVRVEKGAMVWLAVNFVGDVGICDFSTVAQNNTIPVWDDSTDNKSTVAYIAKLNDNAGDFYATARKIAAGHKFRTLNAMDVSGMADPSYGFALCLCIESKASSNTTPTEP